MKRIFLTFLILSWCFSPSTVWCKDPDWIGRWEFTECWMHIGGEQHDCVLYTIMVRANNEVKNYSVEINVDGYMSMQRILAKGLSQSNIFEVQFQKSGKDHLAPEYKPGDVLLRLNRIKDTTVTEWGKIEPVLDSNRAPGKYFQKVTN